MPESSSSQRDALLPTVGPAYRIVTPRLCIRCWNPADASSLKAAIDANMDYLRPWMPWITKEPEPLETRIAQIRKWRARFDLDEDYVYGIFNPDESEVIGGTGLHTRQGKEAREICYWIQQKHQHKGMATEVAAALTRVAFAIDRVRRVHIHCVPSNVKSARIPERLGFLMEGTLRKRLPKASGELEDMMVWTMMDTEYEGSTLSNAELMAYDSAGRRIL
jgi:RimJ/RimL family protein N-acetyltransferase